MYSFYVKKNKNKNKNKTKREKVVVKKDKMGVRQWGSISTSQVVQVARSFLQLWGKLGFCQSFSLSDLGKRHVSEEDINDTCQWWLQRDSGAINHTAICKGEDFCNWGCLCSTLANHWVKENYDDVVRTRRVREYIIIIITNRPIFTKEARIWHTIPKL